MSYRHRDCITRLALSQVSIRHDQPASHSLRLWLIPDQCFSTHTHTHTSHTILNSYFCFRRTSLSLLLLLLLSPSFSEYSILGPLFSCFLYSYASLVTNVAKGKRADWLFCCSHGDDIIATMAINKRDNIHIYMYACRSCVSIYIFGIWRKTDIFMHSIAIY